MKRVGVATVVAVVVAIAIAGVAQWSSHPSQRLSRADVLRYQSQLLPVVRDWGSIEVEGMRPAIADLSSGQGVPARLIAVEARAWQSALTIDQSRLMKIRPPANLRPAVVLFDASIRSYLLAAATFRRAALAVPNERAALIDAGIKAARTGTQQYDAASTLLQQARRAVGLPTTSDFPQAATRAEARP